MVPIKALNFLQTEVAAVVNHNDPVETETFRSLLTYLLSPTPPSPPGSVTPVSLNLPLVMSDEYSKSETDETSKRSRPSSPEEGRWTNELPVGSSTGAARESQFVSADALRETEDQIEQTESGKGQLTSSRFSERTNVFESLMNFVSEGEKQPNGSLLDIIGGEGGSF